MDLTPYVDRLRHQLAVAADVGGDEARVLAERLTAPLESATRLALLGALSAASDEISRALAPGAVDVRLRGLDPEFVVMAPHMAPVAPAVPPPAANGDEGGSAGTARINFRLPAHLKARMEEAAGREGLSVNAWLLRAVLARQSGPGSVH